MKNIIKVLVVFLMIAIMPATNIFAEDEKVLDFTSSVSVDSEGNTVFEISDDYASFAPEIKLDCTLENPTVIGPNNVIVSSEYNQKTINFIADVGGKYVIKELNAATNYLNASGEVTKDVVKTVDGSSVSPSAIGVLEIKSEPLSVDEDILSAVGKTTSQNVVPLNIYVSSDGVELESVVLNESIKVTLKAPNENKEHTNGYDTWKYDVYRKHGTWSKIAKDLVADGSGNIEIMSDRFSTYVIVAKESKTPVPASPSSSGVSTPTYIPPKTGIE